MTRGRFASRVLPLLLYCAAIYVLSSLPDPGAPELQFKWGDKLVHAAAYLVMAVLAARAFTAERRTMQRTLLLAFLFCSLYGATDEFHQSFVPGRDADVFDWVADTLGAAAGVAVLARRGRGKIKG